MLNWRFCCCSLSFMRVNEEPLGLGQSVGQNKQFQDVTLGSGKLKWAFFSYFSFTFYRLNGLLWRQSVWVWFNGFSLKHLCHAPANWTNLHFFMVKLKDFLLRQMYLQLQIHLNPSEELKNPDYCVNNQMKLTQLCKNVKKNKGHGQLWPKQLA